MSKFNQTRTQPTARGYIATDASASGLTGEGAPGYARDAKSELFLLAITNMVSENTFYEKSNERDARYTQLIGTVAAQDPEWTTRFLRWLRAEANMRSASVMGGLEAARAMVKAKIPGSRQIVDSVLQRADEPGEALAYWLNTYGRKIPKPVKRGIADAAQRLYTEYNMLKYDTGSHAVRFADVLDLTHPESKAPWQGDLYRCALARRHGRSEIAEVDGRLPMVLANYALRAASAALPELLLSSDRLKAAGMTWEDALSLAGSRVDKKQLWEALIPNMGYMALLRNLRNFDEAGISEESMALVAATLTNEEAVAKSRQFPFRFLSAHRNIHSLFWGLALEKALNLSVRNIPELPGTTLVLVDRSGSMFGTLSAKTQLDRADAAAVFGSALAIRNQERMTLVEFGTDSSRITVPKNGSVLKLVEKFTDRGGTNTASAVRQHYIGQDRVIILTDEQAHDGDPGSMVPAHVPLYTWNLAGYRFGHGPGKPNRYTFGGLTDQAFSVIPLLERGTDAGWPF